ncbi:hypothetical protein CFIO01_04569 [Colletotrichum fioriniae PJ7]|uniref:Uncharacterized protein n=1 Tax=Colletotrichum fioriniae PJ7 TaxID=1445577 RepID=A0A010R5Z9_9PEZI|nr:hypothetical protein CFIO01_04569 [Colletotrichum fioriniae PJ7]
METDVGDGDSVEVMKEELKGGPVTDVRPDVAETSVGIVNDGVSDREDSVTVDVAKVASGAELSVAVAAFVVDAEVVDDNILSKSVATDIELRSEIGVELKELALWLDWMEGGPDIVLVTNSEDGACVIDEAEFETELTLLVNEFEVDAEVDVKLVFDATVVPARDVVLKEKVLSVNEVPLLDSRLVRRSENVPLELDAESVVKSEEVNVTSVPVLESSSVVELLLNVGMSVDDREVVDKTDVTERELVDDRELTDETELIEDKEEFGSVELELVGYAEEFVKLIERAVVEIELLSRSVVEKVEVVEPISEEEIEEENEFVGTVNVVGSVLDVVVSDANVDDVRENEELKEIVVFANGPPVDVEESCALLLTSMLVFVRDEVAMDSEEVKDDVGVAVDDKVNKELDELELDKEIDVVEKKVGSDEADEKDGKDEVDKIEEEVEGVSVMDSELNENTVEESGDEVEDKVKVDAESEAEEDTDREVEEELEEEVKDVSVVNSELVGEIEEVSEDETDDKVKNEVVSEAEADVEREVKEDAVEEVEYVSVVDSNVDEIVEEEVGVVEDEFEKKLKDEDSALDSESKDVVDDVLDSVDSVVVGAGGTSRKP